MSRAPGNGGNVFLDPDWLTATMASSNCLIGNVTKTYHENDGKLKADKFVVFFYMKLHGNRFALKQNYIRDVNFRGAFPDLLIYVLHFCQDPDHTFPRKISSKVYLTT